MPPVGATKRKCRSPTPQCYAERKSLAVTKVMGLLPALSFRRWQSQRLQISLVHLALAERNVLQHSLERRVDVLLWRPFRQVPFHLACAALQLRVGDNLIPVSRPRERYDRPWTVHLLIRPE